jgi:hypothetical protein
MRFWLCGSAATLAVTLSSNARVVRQAEETTSKRANELTVAGLRPGADTLRRARKLYWSLALQTDDKDGFVLHNGCGYSDLFLETDATGRVATLRLATRETNAIIDCSPKGLKLSPSLSTGRGLAVFDSPQKAILLYGEPTSRSPGTKNGQPLELLYYAFDWAGPDVPQVMEVVCTAPKDGTSGRVVEITLAASSL